MRRRYVALDGEAVEIDSSLDLGSESCNAGVEIRSLAVKYQHFVSGPLGFARHHALSPNLSNGTKLDQEFSFQNGTLRLGSGDQIAGEDGAYYGSNGHPGRVQWAVWEGNAHSLLTFRYTASGDFDLLAVLQNFQLNESSDGISAIPIDRGNSLYISGPKITVDVPDFALLDARQLTPKEARELPKGRGTKVRGGELFVAHKDDHHKYLVLVGETTVTNIHPYDVSDDELLGGVEDLLVQRS